MKTLVELSKEDALKVEGGGVYEVGKYIGSWWANEVDMFHGIWDSFK